MLDFKPVPKETFSLEEIADAIIVLGNPRLNEYKDKRDLIEKLKAGKLVVSIMSTGAIKYPSTSIHYFLEISEKGEVIDYKICAFFSAYCPVIEKGEITHYEKVKST